MATPFFYAKDKVWLLVILLDTFDSSDKMALLRTNLFAEQFIPLEADRDQCDPYKLILNFYFNLLFLIYLSCEAIAASNGIYLK